VVTTAVLVAAVTALAVLIAAAVNHRRPDAPSTPTFAVPQQVDREDFDDPGSPWLLALFTSATCMSCQEAREVVLPLDFGDLTVQDIVYPTRSDLHERYHIDAVPAVVLADAEGVVTWSYVGAPPSSAIVEVMQDLGLLPPDDGVAVDLPS
jgi:hypothetical protein